MRNTFSSMLLTYGSFFVMAPSLAADIVIGVPNWPSVAITAEIIKTVVEDNFGLEVELQNGTNPVVFEAMHAGSMHIHPEVWLPNMQNLSDIYVNEKKTVKSSPNQVEASQGMCITKHTQETTGLTRIEQLTDPKIAAQFDTDKNGKGEVWIGATGWASTAVERIRAKSYGYEGTFELQEMEEGIALAALDNAVKQKKPKVFFCYAPHHSFALYDLVLLEEPKHDPAHWNVIQPTDDPEWLEKSNASTAWPPASFSIHYATTLENTDPDIARLLNAIQLDSETITQMTKAVVVDKTPQDDFARQWISDNESRIDRWLEL